MKSAALEKQVVPRELALFGVVLLAVLYMGFQYLVKPQLKKIDLLQAQVEGLDQEKEALIRFLEATPTLAKNELSLKKKTTKVKILFGDIKPAYNDITQLLAEFTHQEFRGRVAINNFSYKLPIQQNGYGETEFQINLRGDFISILQYVESLEQFPALFRIESVKFKVDDQGVQSIAVDLQGRFYQLTPGKGAPPPPSETEKKT